jgi:bacterial/archaeal transporter family-2 protein
MLWLFLLLALIAGAAIPLQTGVNSQLAKWVGNPTLASTISFIVGTVALLMYSFAMRIPLPALSEFSQAPWWIWLGGLIGAFFIGTTTALASKMSIAVLVSLIITGQMLVSLLVDHFGWLGFEVHPVNIWRIVGAIFLIIGVALIRQF